MKIRSDELGFTAWELVLVIVVLAGIVVAGIHVYDSHMPVSTTVSVSGSTSTSPVKNASTVVPSAPTVTSTADLDSASNSLNQVDPSSSNAADTSQLNSQANF